MSVFECVLCVFFNTDAGIECVRLSVFVCFECVGSVFECVLCVLCVSAFLGESRRTATANECE